ncbi:recombinase family protein [Symmachiella dynata]|uniref:recombinase family protein n=1 Tax=Symmachiella dynata TaxID=2527995 RepID=UPI0030EB2986
MICLNPTDFVTQKEAAQLANVSRQTIWNYSKQGHIETRTNVNRVSVYRLQDVCESFGIDYQEQSDVAEEKRIVVYGRVSSKDQKRDGNLDRQLDRLRDYVAKTWNAEPLEYTDVQSAFSDRPGFNQLCSDVMDGKISIVVCEFADRAQRQSSGKALFEMICKKFNVAIVYVENSIPESAMSEMIDEMVSFMTICCNRISAQKQANRSRVDIDEKILDRVHDMLNSGHTIKSATKVLRDEKVTGINGKPISHHILGQRYKTYLAAKNRQMILTTGQVETQQDAIDKWIDSECNQGTELKESAKALLDAWNAYAKVNGLTESNYNAFARKLKSKGFVNKRGGNGRAWYHGLKLA